MTDRELLESLLQKITSIEANMATKDDIARLEAKIDKLESDSQEDIKAMLEHVDKKTDSLPRIEAKIDVLAHRTFEQEADIQLLKKAK